MAAEVTVVRIYLNEGGKSLDKLLEQLHDMEHIRGVTVFRAIAGYGDSGKMHTSKLIDLSLELPLVVEFFDDSGKAEQVIEHLRDTVKPGHILSWKAHINT